jgi:predicted secreted protein
MSTYEASGATAEAVDDKVQITFEPFDRELEHVSIDPDEAAALMVRLERAIADAERKPELEREALDYAVYKVRFEATMTVDLTGEQLEAWSDRGEIVEAFDTSDFSTLCNDLWLSTTGVDAGFGPHPLDVDVHEVDMEVS